MAHVGESPSHSRKGKSCITSSPAQVQPGTIVLLLKELLGPNLHERVIVGIIVFGNHVGIIVGIFLLWRIWLTSIDLIVVILVERVGRPKAIKSITLLHPLRRNLHK